MGCGTKEVKKQLDIEKTLGKDTPKIKIKGDREWQVRNRIC